MCAGPGEVSNIVNSALFTLPPSCCSWSPTGFDNLGIFTKGNYPLSTSQPSTWGNQRGARSHQLSTSKVRLSSFSNFFLNTFIEGFFRGNEILKHALQFRSGVFGARISVVVPIVVVWE